MINLVVKGIADKIRTVYPQGQYKVYTEGIEQGFNKPCFFIKYLNSDQGRHLGNRYEMTNNFVVHYFSDKRGKNADCRTVESELMDALEYIEVDKQLCMGTKISARMQEGVLLFFVSYNLIVLKPKPAVPNMERIDVDAKVKGGRS